MTSAKQGKFIVIDGMDGSGKGTQIKLLQEKLAGHPVIFTREPGGTPRAEEIRAMLLEKNGSRSTPACDFFLFWAARASHIKDTVAPALSRGEHVICDRYDSSTYAFQLYGEKQRSGMLELLFVRIRDALSSVYKPDAYIILDLPPEVAYERRLKDSSQEKSRFDVKPIEYHARVREGFHRFGEYLGSANSESICHFVDADRQPEDIHTDMWNIVSKEFGI